MATELLAPLPCPLWIDSSAASLVRSSSISRRRLFRFFFGSDCRLEDWANRVCNQIRLRLRRQFLMVAPSGKSPSGRTGNKQVQAPIAARARSLGAKVVGLVLSIACLLDCANDSRNSAAGLRRNTKSPNRNVTPRPQIAFAGRRTTPLAQFVRDQCGIVGREKPHVY